MKLKHCDKSSNFLIQKDSLFYNPGEYVPFK